MADFSRAEYSKNHRASFDAAIVSTRKYLEDLEAEYNKYWEELETLRKERAALIENAIKVLKDNNVKLQKQLCRCNNEELNVELKRSLPHLGFKDLEEIQIAIVKINMRYDKIVELSTQLVRISNELAKFRTPEKDRDEEIVIDFKTAKKSRQEQIREKVNPKPEEVVKKASTEGLEEVVETHKAGDQTIISLNEYLDKNRKKMEESSKENQVMASIIEEEDLQVPESELEISDLTGEVEDIIGILEDTEEGLTESDIIFGDDEVAVLSDEKESEEFVEFVIEKDVTLIDIASKVYDDGNLWEELYKYGSNRGKIDRVAAENKITVKNACTEPGYLNGIELIFPLELVTYEPLGNKKETGKAA